MDTTRARLQQALAAAANKGKALAPPVEAPPVEEPPAEEVPEEVPEEVADDDEDVDDDDGGEDEGLAPHEDDDVAGDVPEGGEAPLGI